MSFSDYIDFCDFDRVNAFRVYENIISFSPNTETQEHKYIFCEGMGLKLRLPFDKGLYAAILYEDASYEPKILEDLWKETHKSELLLADYKVSKGMFISPKEFSQLKNDYYDVVLVDCNSDVILSNENLVISNLFLSVIENIEIKVDHYVKNLQIKSHINQKGSLDICLTKGVDKFQSLYENQMSFKIKGRVDCLYMANCDFVDVEKVHTCYINYKEDLVKHRRVLEKCRRIIILSPKDGGEFYIKDFPLLSSLVFMINKESSLFIDCPNLKKVTIEPIYEFFSFKFNSLSDHELIFRNKINQGDVFLSDMKFAKYFTHPDVTVHFPEDSLLNNL